MEVVSMNNKLLVYTILITCFFLLFSPVLNNGQASAHTINVTLETIFVDGEKAVETTVEEVMAMEDFWGKYHAWQLVDMSKEEVVFRTQVDAYSPLTILSGYSTMAPKQP